jgi:hypothetical protein
MESWLVVLAGATIGLLAAELFDVFPRLAVGIVKFAARLLPGDKDRWAEELLSEVDTVPGKLVKLIFAIRVLASIPRTRIALRSHTTVREIRPRSSVSILLGVALLLGIGLAWLLASQSGADALDKVLATVGAVVSIIALPISYWLGRMSRPQDGENGGDSGPDSVAERRDLD